MKEITLNQVAQDQKPRLIETELGAEKICICCKEYWPLDDEFFYHRMRPKADGSRSKQWEAVCKSCYPVHYNKRTSGKYSIKSAHGVVA